MTESASASAALLARFDREMRTNPPYEPGVRYELADGMVRARGAQNWILAWQIEAADSFAAVGREADYFRRIEAAVEWKVYGHDVPENLAAALEQHGFIPDEPETLLIYDLAAVPQPPPLSIPAEVEIVLVNDQARLADLVTVTAQAFDADATWMYDALPQRLFDADACAAAFVAYVGGRPVAGARIEYARQRSFASLWGGATIPAFRRRGIFTALVAVRVDRAHRAGYRYVTVDARATSRSCLERFGFRAHSTIVGWNLQPLRRRPDSTETPANVIESHAV